MNQNHLCSMKTLTTCSTSETLPADYSNSIMHNTHKSILGRYLEEIVTNSSISELKDCEFKAIKK
jgi:hypothetical protein